MLINKDVAKAIKLGIDIDMDVNMDIYKKKNITVLTATNIDTARIVDKTIYVNIETKVNTSVNIRVSTAIKTDIAE